MSSLVVAAVIVVVLTVLRRWVYASAKRENQYFGFGTDSRTDAPQYPIIRHAAFPFPVPPAVDPTDETHLPCANHYRYDKTWWEPLSSRSDELIEATYGADRQLTSQPSPSSRA